jgi:hypothetical protein
MEQKLGTCTMGDICRLTAGQMRLLRSREGKIKCETIRSNKIGKNLEINTLESKLTNNKLRWYEDVLRMNEERIPKKV